MDFINNKQMYNDALKLFHVKIRQVQKGHLVFVTNGTGNPVRHLIKMSDFEIRPRFYQAKGKGEKIGQNDNNFKDNSEFAFKFCPEDFRVLFDLLRLIPNYSEKNNFRKKKQLIKKRRRGQIRQ